MDSKNQNTEITLLEFLERVNQYLEELTDANRNLLKILKNYQDLLVQGENESVEHATPRLDRAAGQIRMLDEARRLYVDGFFKQMGWTGARNFSAIEEKVMALGVTDEEALAFNRALQSRMVLIGMLAEVDAQNSLNLTLIGQGLSFAEVSLRALLGFGDNPNTYGPDDPGNDGPNFLDARA